MSSCPVCESPLVLIALTPPGRAACRECGARWLRDGQDLPSDEVSAIPNVIGVVRPDAVEPAASVIHIDRRI